MLRRLLDSAVRSRRRYAIDRVIILRVITINLMILLCLWWRICFQQGRTLYKLAQNSGMLPGLFLRKVHV
jgi:hypothetical protein